MPQLLGVQVSYDPEARRAPARRAAIRLAPGLRWRGRPGLGAGMHRQRPRPWLCAPAPSASRLRRWPRHGCIRHARQPRARRQDGLWSLLAWCHRPRPLPLLMCRPARAPPARRRLVPRRRRRRSRRRAPRQLGRRLPWQHRQRGLRQSMLSELSAPFVQRPGGLTRWRFPPPARSWLGCRRLPAVPPLLRAARGPELLPLGC